MLIIEFENDGEGNEEIANYNYRIKVNGTIIAGGHIDSHDRTKGWVELVRRVVVEAEGTPTNHQSYEMAELLDQRERLGR